MVINIASNYRARRRMTQTPVKYPLPCGCAGPKYISKCFVHQELDREQHHEALTGAKMKAENARLLAENARLRAELAAKS